MTSLPEKRARKSKQSADFLYPHPDSPETSHEQNISPIKPAINQDKDEHRIFLRRTFKYMAGENEKNQVYLTDLPDQTNEWLDPPTAEKVYKLFKVRTCVYDVETILWPANIRSVNLYNWYDIFDARPGKSKVYYDAYFDYLDTVFEPLDFDEISWYAGAKTRKELLNKVEALFAVILKNLRDYPEEHALQGGMARDIVAMEDRIGDWLCTLRTLLQINLADIPEATFEELFRFLLPIVGFSCHRGNYVEKLNFRYNHENKQHSVTSEPDLLVCSKEEGTLQGYTVAVVEVKKPLMKGKQPESGPACGQEAVAGTSSKELGSSCSLLKSDYPNGSPRLPTEEEISAYSTFLPQLFGEVIAAVNCSGMKLCSYRLTQVPRGHLAVKSVIGFGVVGFEVYVVNFMCVRRDLIKMDAWKMHQIPCIDGMGTDILISEPLHMLKRSDRNKLFRLLAAIKSTTSSREH